MTSDELLVLLADKETRSQVQRLLGLPTDRVADRLEELTAAQARTDQAVKDLAAEVKTLAAAQARTDQTVKDLAAEVKTLAAAQARTDQAVKDLAAEVKTLAAAQARTDQTVRELTMEVKALAAAQAKTDQSMQELSRAMRETRQAVATLSNNVGFGLEELAAIVLPDLLRQKAHVSVAAFERRFFTTSAGEEEIDLFAEADRQGEIVAVVGEVKSRIYSGEVERFVKRVERLRPVLGQEIVPVMFGFVVHPSASQAAVKTGVLVVASRPSSLAA